MHKAILLNLGHCEYILEIFTACGAYRISLLYI